jgi:hypothetical protein
MVAEQWLAKYESLKHLPVSLQSQIAVILRPLRLRTAADNHSLLSLLREIRFFKERNISVEVLRKIGSIATYKFQKAGEKVFS